MTKHTPFNISEESLCISVSIQTPQYVLVQVGEVFDMKASNFSLCSCFRNCWNSEEIKETKLIT